jgi:hypothetical protein
MHTAGCADALAEHAIVRRCQILARGCNKAAQQLVCTQTRWLHAKRCGRSSNSTALHPCAVVGAAAKTGKQQEEKYVVAAHHFSLLGGVARPLSGLGLPPPEQIQGCLPGILTFLSEQVGCSA